MIVLSKIGSSTNVPLQEWIVDSASDLNSLPNNVPFGSTAYVIDEKKVKILNGNNEWIDM